MAVWLQQRHQAIAWAPARPLTASAAVTSLLGAVANAHAPVALLSLSLSLLIVFAGVSALFPPKPGAGLRFDPSRKAHRALMAGIGGLVGFFSGLTGAGGPVLSIPIMVALGFPPLVSIAAGQVLQVAGAASGTLGNLWYGVVDGKMAAWLTALQLLGLVVGIRLSHRTSPVRLRRLVAVVCLLVGTFGCLRALCAL